MKALSSSRLTFVLGLALGLMVFWASAVQGTARTNSLIGGWYPVEGCPRCTGTDASSEEANCPSGYTWPGYPPEGEYLGCAGGDLTICIIGGTGSKCCGPDDSAPICNDNGGTGWDGCNYMHDATCTTGNCDP